VDQAFTRFCRREGLNPSQHADGSIGLYPHSTKRGKEWEEYVDALRDEGQKV
jgi:peptidyl-tRNA hydrolase